uniref:G-protein coupled receptors family 1 profile domain-containing protein n=1 Tax=Eptatretus burgeri TaxID=7764 RepID=A0A8C4Q2F6_EPTBU
MPCPPPTPQTQVSAGCNWSAINPFLVKLGLQTILWVFTAIMCFSIVLNLGIIMACFSRRFDKPMLLYIALCSVSDLSWGITGISYYLSSALLQQREITFISCLFEMFCLYFTLLQQFLTIFIMYIDRHWAIFWPYTYVALIANKGGALKLAAVVWIIGLVLSLVYPIVTAHMVFCNDVVVLSDVTCVFGPVEKASCRQSNLFVILTAIIMYSVFGLTGLTATYSTWCIIRKCRNSSTEANIKAFHTCLTQLFVTMANFTSVVIMSVLKRFLKHPRASFFLDVIGLVSPATIDPLIFGLRTQEIRLVFIHVYHNLKIKLTAPQKLFIGRV